MQADAEAWIDARITAREWTRLSAKNAYDIFATRHKQAGGENEDLWLCVRDKLLKCAFEDRLQRGPVHGSHEVAVVLFSGSQSTTMPIKHMNAEREQTIRMGPNFKDAKVGRPIDISSIEASTGAQGEIISAVVRRWNNPLGRAWSTTLVQAGIPCRWREPRFNQQTVLLLLVHKLICLFVVTSTDWCVQDVCHEPVQSRSGQSLQE